MTTSYDPDPNTQTVAAAWASSPFGQPDRDADFGYADPVTEVVVPATEERRPVARHAIIALVLAGGIAAGAALGLMSVDVTPNQPTVVVPGLTSPRPAVIVSPSVQIPPPIKASQNAPAPATVAPAIPRTPSPAPAPAAGPAEKADVPVPADPPPAPEPAEPNPPMPVPPDLDLKLPDPKPKPPSMPDFDIAAGPGS